MPQDKDKNMEYQFKDLEERFRSLPKAMQIALTSAETANTMKKIAEAHRLGIEQESALYDITSYVMLGLIHPTDFVHTYSKEARIGEKQAREIADDINREVFEKIKSSMKEEVEEKKENDTTSQTDYKENINDNLVENNRKSPEEKLKPTHVSELEKAGGFTIEELGHPINKHEMMVVDRRSEPDQVEQAKMAPLPKALAYNPPQIKPRYQEKIPVALPTYSKTEPPPNLPIAENIQDQPKTQAEPSYAKEPVSNVPDQQVNTTSEEIISTSESDQKVSVEKNLLAIKEDAVMNEGKPIEALLRQNNEEQASPRIKIDQSATLPTFIPAMGPIVDIKNKEEIEQVPTEKKVEHYKPRPPEPFPIPKITKSDLYRESIE